MQKIRSVYLILYVQCYTTNMVNLHDGNFPESVIFKRFGLFIALFYPMLTFDCLRKGRLVLITCDFFYADSRIQGYCNFLHNHPYHTCRAFLMYV